MQRTTWQIENDIDAVERRLLSIKDELAEWSDAAIGLGLSAAEQRARNAEMGRGLGGAMLGAKYRAASRRAAASSNAAIARDVAGRRRVIATGEQVLRDEERGLRWQLRDLKADLRDARAVERTAIREAPKSASPSSAPRHLAALTSQPQSLSLASAIKDQLRALKPMHEEGALDAAAYERARITLLEPHVRS